MDSQKLLNVVIRVTASNENPVTPWDWMPLKLTDIPAQILPDRVSDYFHHTFMYLLKNNDSDPGCF